MDSKITVRTAENNHPKSESGSNVQCEWTNNLDNWTCTKPLHRVLPSSTVMLIRNYGNFKSKQANIKMMEWVENSSTCTQVAFLCCWNESLTSSSAMAGDPASLAILSGGWVNSRLNFRSKIMFHANIYGPLDRGMIILQLCRWKFSQTETFVADFIRLKLNFI